MGRCRERRTECRCRHYRFLRVALVLSVLINCPRSRGGFPANGSYGVRSTRFFVCGHPPTSWIPQIGSGWCCARPRRSDLVAGLLLPERLIAPPRGRRQRPDSQPAPVRSSAVPGHRKQSVGKTVANGRRGGSARSSATPRRSQARRRLPRPEGRRLRVLPPFARLSWRRPSGRQAPRRGRADHRCRRGCALRRGHRRPHDPAARRRPGSGGGSDGIGGTRADRLRSHDGFRGGHAGDQAGAVHGRLSRSGRFPFR